MREWSGDGFRGPASARELVDEIGWETSLSRSRAAQRFQLIDELRLVMETETGASWTAPDDLAWRDLRAEVAAVLGVHERTAQVQLDLARRLTHDFPATLHGLRTASFSEIHARILVDESAELPPELLPVYEERLLPAAPDLLASRFAKFAREVRASLQPEALIERHEEALLARRVAVEAAPDGMAWFGALLPAQDAIDAVGAVPAGAAGASPAARRGVRPEVLVHVPVLTVIGRSDDGALLDGYGPIDADTARELCAEAPGLVRVLTDPDDDAVLSFGRTTYRVPAELKRFLRVRDEVCRFVGCTRSAALSDIDHTIPWQEDGETVESNLAHVCRGHHRVEERRRWKIGHDPGGRIRWTSPTGREYETQPARRGFPPVGVPPRPMVEWLLRNEIDTPSDSPPGF